MAKKGNKTKPTKVSPVSFLESVEHPQRRADGLELLNFFSQVTQLRPIMWGPSLIGYGRYAYEYKSGHGGELFLTGFSPRKTALTIYTMPGYQNFSAELSKLGKHKTGKSCLYINKLSDIDLDVLTSIVEGGLHYMRENYETWDE